jgi:PEP-CTERM motif
VRNTKVKSGQAGDFEKKLMRYALAGTAVLGLPMASQATIIPGITQTGTASTDEGSSTLNISFDNAAVTDFTLIAGFSTEGSYPYVSVSGPATTFFVGSQSGEFAFYPTAFAAAYPNPGGVTSGPLGGNSGKLLKLKSSSTKGNFPNNSSAYLGVVFQIGNQNYLGWADIAISEETTDPTATLLSSAYLSTPLSSPEPSSIALFALGAAGLAVIRQRRNAAR